MTVAEKAEWLPLMKAAKEVGISMGKLESLIKTGAFQIKRDPRDFRKKLINVTELREYLNRKE